MDKNQKFVITINRELGSGGRTVGRKLAEKLNVPFYDKTLINELKKKYNLSTDQIEKVKGTKTDWWREIINAAIFMGNNMNEMSEYEYVEDTPDYYLATSADMYKVEREILTNVAADGSCIVAGRSGFNVFANHPNHLNIFFYASMEHRIQRILSKQDLTREEAEKTIKKVDEMRENYVKKYAGVSRYDARNYDLVINMDGKTEDEAVKLILDYIG